MNAAMKIARMSLVQPFRPTAMQKPRLTPMPNLHSMGNRQAHLVQLFAARIALRQRELSSGFLVFTDTGEVKYYAEHHSFAVVHLAAFTNMPVYSIKWRYVDNKAACKRLFCYCLGNVFFRSRLVRLWVFYGKQRHKCLSLSCWPHLEISQSCLIYLSSWLTVVASTRGTRWKKP